MNSLRQRQNRGACRKDTCTVRQQNNNGAAGVRDAVKIAERRGKTRLSIDLPAYSAKASDSLSLLRKSSAAASSAVSSAISGISSCGAGAGISVSN
jgi:hypothetical protein